MDKETQLDRIEGILKSLIEKESKNATDIKWFKSIGMIILAAFTTLFGKIYGSH